MTIAQLVSVTPAAGLVGGITAFAALLGFVWLLALWSDEREVDGVRAPADEHLDEASRAPARVSSVWICMRCGKTTRDDGTARCSGCGERAVWSRS